MAYESDPSGLGVGKRYGPLGLGGQAGTIRSNDLEEEAVFEIKAGEDDASNAQTISIPAYSRIIKCYSVVTEAYAALSTVDVQLDGTTILGAVVDLTALGNLDETLTVTDADLVTTTAAEDITVVVNANGLASTTGQAKLIVQYVRK